MLTSSRRPRVLLADDYPDLLAAFRRLLAAACEVVGSVADGTALFEAVATLQPDVIVVDLFIPPRDGLEICRRLKQVAPETPVIITSASTDTGVGERAVRAGAFAFVAKISAVDDLWPAIQRATATRTHQISSSQTHRPDSRLPDGQHQRVSPCKDRISSLAGGRRMQPGAAGALAPAGGLSE